MIDVGRAAARHDGPIVASWGATNRDELPEVARW